MEQPNLNYINELSGDDAEFKQKMISIFKEELPKEIENYRSLLESKDYNATAEMVHKLKHKISILSLEKSYYIAEEFEKNLKQSSIVLQNEFEEIIKNIQNFVDDL